MCSIYNNKTQTHFVKSKKVKHEFVWEKEHKELFDLNKRNSQEIEKYVRSIANKRAKNDMMKLKIK